MNIRVSVDYQELSWLLYIDHADYYPGDKTDRDPSGCLMNPPEAWPLSGTVELDGNEEDITDPTHTDIFNVFECAYSNARFFRKLVELNRESVEKKLLEYFSNEYDPY